MIARPAHRTVCGMLAGAGLAGVWHHSRAHRFADTHDMVRRTLDITGVLTTLTEPS